MENCEKDAQGPLTRAVFAFAHELKGFSAQFVPSIAVVRQDIMVTCLLHYGQATESETRKGQEQDS